MKVDVLISLLGCYCGLSGCAPNIETIVTVKPKHFKVQLPFELGDKGIIINSNWGASKIKHKLYWDNHSLTWANKNLIQNNSSIVKSNDIFYRTTTADGTPIKGNVYVCDSISLDDVTFKNVALYSINDIGKANINGVFGENLISKGIWKIDFKKKILTFASSIDSIGELHQTYQLPTKFRNSTIEIKITFHEMSKTLQVDLGYNGHMIMPLKGFQKIAPLAKNTYTIDSFRLSTPTTSTIVKYTAAYDTIKVGQYSFETVISTNELIKENLIGLGFFAQFEFVVFDYVNKSVSVSKTRNY